MAQLRLALQKYWQSGGTPNGCEFETGEDTVSIKQFTC